MDAIPIIVIGFNRPGSLTRLFKSLDRAVYSHSDIPLYISLDRSDNSQCVDIAHKFQWNYGPKHIIEQKDHLGLYDHVMRCGNLVEELGSGIILEDDLIVSPHFYGFAEQATKAYKAESSIAGISLYSYSYTESKFLPFKPLSSEFDTYFMQVSSSWGQIWFADQWKAFRTWLDKNPVLSDKENVPDYLLGWGENSWKKHFNRYLLDQQKYFVYPYVSYTTNFEDPGTHASTLGLFQVPLNLLPTEAKFDTLSTSKNRYDAWFELEENSLKRLCPELAAWPITVDVYGTKRESKDLNEFVLTSRPTSTFEKSWNGDMHPKIQAVVAGVEGNGMYLAKAQNIDWERKTKPLYHFQIRSLLEKMEREKAVFHILIPCLGSTSAQIQESLHHLERQSYECIQVTLFIASDQTLDTLNTSLPLEARSLNEKSMMDALREKVSSLHQGLVMFLEPGYYMKNDVLIMMKSIFEQHNNIDWVHSVSLDKKGFIPFKDRWRLSAESVVHNGQGLIFDPSLSFFRSSWFQRKSIQSAMEQSSLEEFLVQAARGHCAPTLVAKRFYEKEIFHQYPKLSSSSPAGVALLVHLMCTLLGKVSSSTLPHKFYTIYFNLGDTIRFDNNHNTWYRERF